jgi:hypothetical protein
MNTQAKADRGAKRRSMGSSAVPLHTSRRFIQT